MSFEQRLEKPPITSFGFFSRKTMASEEEEDFSRAGPLVSRDPTGKTEGLRRPCRCQPLCACEPSPEAAACSAPSSGLPGSRRCGQLDAFSSGGWPGLPGCLAPLGSEARRLCAPSGGAGLRKDPVARASGFFGSPGSEGAPRSSRVQGVVGEEGLRRAVTLLKAMTGATSLLLLMVEAKESDLPTAGGQEVRPAAWGMDAACS